MNNCAEIDFSFNLFRQLITVESNVISPISIRLAFAVAHAGARGQSRSEIVSTFSGEIDDDEFLSSTTQLSQELNTVSSRKILNVANKAFLSEKCIILPSFQKEIADRYSAEAVTVDLQDKEQVAETVNTFVSNSTGGKIKNVLSPDSIDDNSIAFLVNAACFDEKWKSPFLLEDTTEGDFYDEENTTHKVHFMHQLESFDYFENEKFQMLALPYTHKDFSFVILLPKERCKINQKFETFSGEEFRNCLNSMCPALVQLQFPKMNIDTSAADLKKYLKNLGIRTIFDAEASDLLNMVNEKSGINPYIEKTIHRATIEVTEDGTVATAGSVIEARGGSCMSGETPQKIIPFIADHPFIFCIMYKKKHVLFIGKKCGESLARWIPMMSKKEYARKRWKNPKENRK